MIIIPSLIWGMFGGVIITCLMAMLYLLWFNRHAMIEPNLMARYIGGRIKYVRSKTAKEAGDVQAIETNIAKNIKTK